MSKNLITRSSSSSPSSLPSHNKYVPRNTLRFGDQIRDLIIRRKRYSFQILKQFYLFPDQTSSSEKTVGKYDQLIFSDEALHTLFKKLETKIIQRKIWAFINLRAMRYMEQIKSFNQQFMVTKTKIETKFKILCFGKIRIFSYERSKVVKRDELLNSETVVRSSSIKKLTVINPTGIRMERVPLQNQSKMREQYHPQQGRRQSRSISNSKYQFQMENGHRVLLNGQIVPTKIRIGRLSPSESPHRYRKNNSPKQNVNFVLKDPPVVLSQHQINAISYEYVSPLKRVTVSPPKVIKTQKYISQNLNNVSNCSKVLHCCNHGHCCHCCHFDSGCLAVQSQKNIKPGQIETMRRQSSYLEHLKIVNR